MYVSTNIFLKALADIYAIQNIVQISDLNFLFEHSDFQKSKLDPKMIETNKVILNVFIFKRII